MTEGSPVGQASIREHAIAWHRGKKKYYLIADVVTLDNPHHPNTYNTQLYLWSSRTLSEWKFHGLAVAKGTPGRSYDGYGTASPAGMAYRNGRLYVAFSGRKTKGFSRRSIGLAWSGEDPEELPWKKSPSPISDLVGEDDDAAAMVKPGENRLHVYHRTTGPGGYRIVHTWSATPQKADSWSKAVPATARPAGVRAQELTGAAWFAGKFRMFVIEHLREGGDSQIAHLQAESPDGPFQQTDPRHRYVRRQPSAAVYSGHLTPVVRRGKLTALFWTAHQRGKRYGLLGHPVSSR